MVIAIEDYKGDIYNLSDEKYVIVNRDTPTDKHDWRVSGTVVRLISGVCGNETPGYHTKNGWRTVCPIDSDIAKFVGMPWANLKRIE